MVAAGQVQSRRLLLSPSKLTTGQSVIFKARCEPGWVALKWNCIQKPGSRGKHSKLGRGVPHWAWTFLSSHTAPAPPPPVLPKGFAGLTFETRCPGPGLWLAELWSSVPPTPRPVEILQVQARLRTSVHPHCDRVLFLGGFCLLSPPSCVYGAPAWSNCTEAVVPQCADPCPAPPRTICVNVNTVLYLSVPLIHNKWVAVIPSIMS